MFYEAPQRLAVCLADLAAELGDTAGERRARADQAARDRALSAPLDELAAHYAGDETKGEIVVVVAPPPARAAVDPSILRANWTACSRRTRPSDAADVLAARHGLPRRDLYALALELSRGRKPP